MYRAETQQVDVISATALIPHNVGGFFIREVGVFDSLNNLILVAKQPLTYKPQEEQGGIKDIWITVRLKGINPDVIAIQKGKYEAREVTVFGGKSYEILYSSLEPEIQEKLEDEEMKCTALVPVNNKPQHKFNTYCELNIKPVYVHGKALANDSCNLVLGTHTFEFNPSQIPFPTSFNIFQKHYQRHKYGTIEPYQDLLRQIEKSKTLPKFHIIEHSLDKTDHKILQHILRANKDCVINIYYHKEEAQELLMNKIDTIIGEEEVMSKVRFIHQHDEQRGILKLKEKSIVVVK